VDVIQYYHTANKDGWVHTNNLTMEKFMGYIHIIWSRAGKDFAIVPFGTKLI